MQQGRLFEDRPEFDNGEKAHALACLRARQNGANISGQPAWVHELLALWEQYPELVPDWF